MLFLHYSKNILKMSKGLQLSSVPKIFKSSGTDFYFYYAEYFIVRVHLSYSDSEHFNLFDLCLVDNVLEIRV